MSLWNRILIYFINRNIKRIDKQISDIQQEQERINRTYNLNINCKHRHEKEFIANLSHFFISKVKDYQNN